MIIGNRVILKALRKKDASQMLEWVNDPDLKSLTGTVFPISEIEHENWFEKKMNESINKTFGIEELSSKKIIGIIGLNNTDLINRNTEIFIYIGIKDFWGQGLGSDALETMVKFIFNELNLFRISLKVFSYNQRAIASYEKVGFVKEGRLRKSVFKDGKYHDTIVMAMLNDI